MGAGGAKKDAFFLNIDFKNILTKGQQSFLRYNYIPIKPNWLDIQGNL